MYVLGIAGALTHDCSACLMLEGKVIAMVEEERFTRIPHAYSQLPIYSIEYCLNEANITIDDVSYIALSWDEKLFTENKTIDKKYMNIFDIISVFNPTKKPRVEVVDHHLAHAASSFYFSPFDESTVLVVDGTGENNSTSLFVGKGNKLNKVYSTPDNQSLGEFYSAATSFLGFGANDAGKTMGLSSFGKRKFDIESLVMDPKIGYKIINNPQMDFFEQELFWKTEFLKMGLKPNSPIRKYNKYRLTTNNEYIFDDIYKDFAASVQGKLEDCLLNLVKTAINKTGINNICFSGGVALNCVANGKIEALEDVNDIFIQPASNDAGTAIGAAAEISARLGYKIEKEIDIYKGPSFNNESVEIVLKNLGIKSRVSKNLLDDVTDFIVDGKIVGWFQGKMEYGPRALGNRSILANPNIEGINYKINEEVKYREIFRPFGASIIEEEASNWFENIKSSPYMLKTYNVIASKQNLIPGAVHVDGSSRPQTVTEIQNSKYYDLISNFNRLTGIPMLLNTSFNIRGESMVCTPYDAIKTFYSSGLDLLVINDFIIKKDY